jgi:WS/DGAT/MGAT family acyltransferase
MANDPATASNRVGDALRAVGDFVREAFAAPASSLNQPIGAHRRLETILTDLGQLKRIKNSLGGTVNDVVLSVVAGGLRGLLEARGEAVHDLEIRALIPVSLRRDHDKGSLGNQLAAMWAALPVYEADAVRRLVVVTKHMKDLKSSGQAVGAQLLSTFGEWVPPALVAQAAHLLGRQRAFNLAVTNVPGPQMPLYALGREMQEVYPLLPLTDNTTVGVALLSYNGTVGWGLLGDYDTTGDLGVLAEGIEKSIAQLVAAAG